MKTGRYEAETLMKKAEDKNPGMWIRHSYLVAACAEKIAELAGMERDMAYVFGLLHDIGKRFGTEENHMLSGYRYLMGLGDKEAAKICITHAYPTLSFDDYSGKYMIDRDEKEFLEDFLKNCELDDYDRLIQLSDGFMKKDMPVSIEERAEDIRERYGFYSERKLKKLLEIKKYFDDKTGEDTEKIAGSVRER